MDTPSACYIGVEVMEPEKPEVELTKEERDLIDQLLDMYAENPSNRNEYRSSMYFLATELKNGRNPIGEQE